MIGFILICTIGPAVIWLIISHMDRAMRNGAD